MILPAVRTRWAGERVLLNRRHIAIGVNFLATTPKNRFRAASRLSSRAISSDRQRIPEMYLSSVCCVDVSRMFLIRFSSFPTRSSTSTFEWSKLRMIRWPIGVPGLIPALRLRSKHRHTSTSKYVSLPRRGVEAVSVGYLNKQGPAEGSRLSLGSDGFLPRRVSWARVKLAPMMIIICQLGH